MRARTLVLAALWLAPASAQPVAAQTASAPASRPATQPASQPASQPGAPACGLDPAQLPPTWRPLATAPLRARLSQTPWNSDEAADAARAVERGLDEMVEFFHAQPERAVALADNAVECFLDVAYGAPPALRERARQHATVQLERCAAPWLRRRPGQVRAADFAPLLTLALYAHQLLPPDSATTAGLARRCQRALTRAGSLAKAIGFDVAARTAPDAALDVDAAYELVLWCVSLIEAQSLPGLEPGDDSRQFVLRAWPRLSTYRLRDARDSADLANDTAFYDCAYLATHIGYVPTGYGRHRLAPADAPELYRYLRENFYAVLELGELDLVAEFVDLLRQMGCSERDDLQVRDGTRHLLRLYHAAGDRWMAHREPDEGPDVDDYDLLHKPWTGIAGVRARVPEPEVPGSYGAVFRGLFPAAAASRPAGR